MTITRRAALGAVTLAVPALAARHAAAQAPARPATPAFQRIAVGGLEAVVVTDGIAVRPDATQGFVMNATPAQVSAAMQAGGLQGPALDNPFNVTVVKTPRGLVMLDVGRGIQGSQLMANRAPPGSIPRRWCWSCTRISMATTSAA